MLILTQLHLTQFKLAGLATLIALVCLGIQANPLAETGKRTPEAGIPNDPLALGEDGSLFLSGQTCEGADEELRPGALPTCEPTCSNPRPMCPKIFYSGIDFVPCFCKKPLVRNEQTKQCVELSKCPKLS